MSKFTKRHKEALIKFQDQCIKWVTETEQLRSDINSSKDSTARLLIKRQHVDWVWSECTMHNQSGLNALSVSTINPKHFNRARTCEQYTCRYQTKLAACSFFVYSADKINELTRALLFVLLKKNSQRIWSSTSFQTTSDYSSRHNDDDEFTRHCWRSEFIEKLNSVGYENRNKKSVGNQ